MVEAAERWLRQDDPAFVERFDVEARELDQQPTTGERDRSRRRWFRRRPHESS